MAALEGSKSIKIRQCNENLAIVDEWPLFRGAVIQGFHCISNCNTHYHTFLHILSLSAEKGGAEFFGYRIGLFM